MSFTNTVILASLLQAHGQHFQQCPPEKMVRRATKSLHKQALANKAAFALSHLIECPRCRGFLRPSLKKHLATAQKISIFSRLQYEQEKHKLSLVLKKKKIRALFYKDTPEKLRQPFFFAQDIDVLTNPHGAKTLDSWFIKNGHSKTAYPPKEITYSSGNQMKIDLHTLVAYPHFGSLSNSEMIMVQKFSADILNTKKNNNFEIENQPYLLLSLCIRFLHNDLMTGLGLLNEIGQQARQLTNPASWKQFLRLTKKYHFTHEALFFVALSACFFNFRLPRAVRQSIPLRIWFLAQCLPVSWFAEFPSLKNWHAKKYQSQVAFLRRRSDLLKIIVGETTTFSRLIRPGIIFFVGQAWLLHTSKKIRYY